MDYLQLTWIESELAEADDIIFTLAKRFDGEIFIASSDTDFYQCIDEDTKILKVRGSKNIEVLGEHWISHRLGIAPEQYVYFKALTGDKADNITGLSGVGPKTASRIVNDEEFAQKFESSSDLITKNVDLIKLKEVDDLRVEWGEWPVDLKLVDLKNKDLFEEVGF